MEVTLTPHGEELVRDQLARGLGASPAEIIERALESAATQTALPVDEEKQRRREAVAAMHAFRARHHLTLGPGLRIRDLIYECRKY